MRTLDIQNQRLIVALIESVLQEGGLTGHMSHLYDNRHLTMGEMKEVFDLAVQGKLEQVSEKLDGQNFFFTYDLATNQVKFARNKSNIKTGGMAGQDIAAKWADVPQVAKAFGMAYSIMNAAFSSLPRKTLESIFSPNGAVWFSAEVIASVNPNVINYDRNVIVFHRSGTVYDQNGNAVADVSDDTNFKQLISAISSLQEKVANSGWQIMGPILVSLNKLATKKPAIVATTKLNALMSKYGLSDSSTIGDYLKKALEDGPLRELDVPNEARSFIADVITNDQIGVREKKARLQNVITDPQDLATVSGLIGNAPKIMTTLAKPIEQIVHEFAVAVLEGVHSMLVTSPDNEVRRLQDEVQNALDRIKSSGNEELIKYLDIELGRLKGTDRITSSLEGIVFKFKGKTYKFTGNFAPVNQILGLVRYGRGGAKI